MKEIVIISGKGGTGKTSLTASFAHLAQNAIVCDADVDAADLHMLLNPVVKQNEDFYAGAIAEIDKDECASCGQCLSLCRFNAVTEDFTIDPYRCEGCGVCVDFCPVGAIKFPPQKCGDWFVSDTAVGPMVHAKLGIAQENSGRLVSLIRKETSKIAQRKKLETIITDGPPGIGCPVIASITGASMLVIVVEPSVSGKHDMERVLKLAEHFKIPVMVIINKFDLNPEMTGEIEKIAKEKDLEIAGRIPFDKEFTQAMVEGKTILEFNDKSKTAESVTEAWAKIDAASAKIAQPLDLVQL